MAYRGERPGRLPQQAGRMTHGSLPARIGVTINPTTPGQVIAFVPGGMYQQVMDWKELLGLLREHGSDLTIDPAHSEEIVRVLNGR